MRRTCGPHLWLAAAIFLLGAAAMGGCAADADKNWVDDKGWVNFGSFASSPDQVFIRDYVKQDPDYAESQEFFPWYIEDLRVGYYDLNDDGVPELFISFAEISPAHCGTDGCDLVFFEMRDGHWQEIGGMFAFNIWVSDEIVMGYRTLYGLRGEKLQWNGKEYDFSCVEMLPVKIRPRYKIRCDPNSL